MMYRKAWIKILPQITIPWRKSFVVSASHELRYHNRPCVCDFGVYKLWQDWWKREKKEKKQRNHSFNTWIIFALDNELKRHTLRHQFAISSLASSSCKNIRHSSSKLKRDCDVILRKGKGWASNLNDVVWRVINFRSTTTTTTAANTSSATSRPCPT